MRKILSILLAFIFLINTSGMAISLNYCTMKKTAAFSLSSKKSCCCKGSKPGNCCKKNQVKIVKIKDCVTSSSISLAFSDELTLFTANSLHSNYSISAHPGLLLTGPHAPPPGNSVSRNILFGTFLI